MVRFDRIVADSAEWTKILLFKPFSLKKWLILSFVILLAVEYFGGRRTINFSYSLGIQEFENNSQFFNYKSKIFNLQNFFEEIFGQKKFFEITFLSVILLYFVFCWLHSRFLFIYLDNIINNNVSIVQSWKSNKVIANSMFLFIFFVGLVTFIVFALFFFRFLEIMLDFNKAERVIEFIRSGGLLLLKVLAFSLSFSIVRFIVNDFIALIMFKEKIKFLEAFKKAFVLIFKNKATVLVFGIIKLALFICCVAVYNIMMNVISIVWSLPIVIWGFVLMGIKNKLPINLEIFGLIGNFIFFILDIFMWSISIFLYLPFSVFLRTVSIKFIGALDNKYELFSQN